MVDKTSTMRTLKVISACALVAVLVGPFLFKSSIGAKSENGCCAFPCQNNGVCMRGREPGSYTCDCTNLNYHGVNCDTPYFGQRIKMMLKPSPDTSHWLLTTPWLSWLLGIVNRVPFLQNYFMKGVVMLRGSLVDSPALYSTKHDYPTVATWTNASVYARTLPPVPEGCPTPMGEKGPKVLPDPELLLNFFRRKTFRPDPMGSSVLLTYFAQHFTHMFFKTAYTDGPGASWSGHGVDVTSLYGKDVKTENLLRSGKDGKLKMQTLNGEEFPMYLKDAPGVEMTYFDHVPEERRFALGHPFYGLLPGLFLYQTIFMREHNRVCDVMREEHPDWDDERIYQTVKLIIIGETIKIVIEEYVQHLAGYNINLKFTPTAIFGEPFQYQNKIHIEFNHLYHWHPLMPDDFNISGTVYPMKDYMFHSELVVNYGTAAMTESLSRQRAGMMSHHNHGPATQRVVRDLIIAGRKLRFQPLNNYRKRFNLRPYTSFEDLTGEKELAAELQKLYKHIDAVEFNVGIYMEKRRHNGIFGATITEMGAPYSVKGLFANPICTPQFWKPSTFGGDKGFEIVNTATMEKLFCGNIPGKCPLVSFRVPDYKPGDVDDLGNFKVVPLKDEL